MHLKKLLHYFIEKEYCIIIRFLVSQFIIEASVACNYFLILERLNDISIILDVMYLSDYVIGFIFRYDYVTLFRISAYISQNCISLSFHI